MTKRKSRSDSPQAQGGAKSTTIKTRQVPGRDEWELVHPSCARQRADDIVEVRRMIEMGEHDIAIDELRWLLSGCGDFVEAHRLLGELALLEGDVRLARGHFGYAYELAMIAIRQSKAPGPFTYRRTANQAFLESAKGLAHCLAQIDKSELAREVLETLTRLDPSDPLGAAAMLSELPRSLKP
ncbi:MAG: hypothetical protein K1X71_17675 [Pirellulales bacterium]|nr:hypothetical protein [Pirellulales bacterium]